MAEIEKLLPRKIWMLWYQGLSEAPFIVRKCIDSWIKENPTWDIVVLDANCLDKYIKLDSTDGKIARLSRQLQSDLVRVALLSKYGGVWADATTFCVRPLDEWIDDFSSSGFFAFYRPGKDRIMSSWFIASKKDCHIVSELYKRFTLFWVQNNFNNPTRLQRKVTKKLSGILNRSDKTTRYWFSPLITKFLRVYPYFVFHYMFERLVSTDPKSQIIWENTKKLSADGPHFIQRYGLLSRPTEESKNQIDNKNTPLYKLTWKYDHSQYSQNSLLYYLIQSRGGEKKYNE